MRCILSGISKKKKGGFNRKQRRSAAAVLARLFDKEKAAVKKRSLTINDETVTQKLARFRISAKTESEKTESPKVRKVVFKPEESMELQPASALFHERRVYFAPEASNVLEGASDISDGEFEDPDDREFKDMEKTVVHVDLGYSPDRPKETRSDMVREMELAIEREAAARNPTGAANKNDDSEEIEIIEMAVDDEGEDDNLETVDMTPEEAEDYRKLAKSSPLKPSPKK